MFNLLITLLCISLIDSRTFEEDAIPPLPPFIGDVLREYLTPLGPGVKKACVNASERYLALLNDLDTLSSPGDRWVYKMQDASAKWPRLGLMEGHAQFPGNFQSCLEIRTADERIGVGKHCMMLGEPFDPTSGVKMTREVLKRQIADRYSRASRGQLIRGLQTIYNGPIEMGRCVPSVCDEDDVQAGWENFFDDIHLTWYKPHVMNCHTEGEKISLDSADYGMIGLLAVFGTLIAIGTIVDGILNISIMGSIISEKFLQVFQGFSVYSNTLKLFNTENKNKDSLTCINGIRVLSLFWVAIGHVYASFGPYGKAMVNNINIFRSEYMHNDAMGAIFNAYLSVDTFFIIGATLLTFITLKELDKAANNGATATSNAFFWFKYYVHRYIRLTGVYAVILFFHASLIKLFATGPQSSWVMMHHDVCQDNWWKNLLYINNLVLDNPATLDCMPHTWYLGVEMQCFIITPIILWPIWKFPKYGLGFLSTLTFAATGVSIGLAWDRDYPPTLTLSMGEGYQEDYYIVPWVRIQAYFIGMILGFILYKMRNNQKLNLNSIAATWCWAIAFAVGCAVVYGANPWLKKAADIHWTHKEIPLAARSLYNGLHRVGWGLAVGWVILACVKGAGGPVNTFLSWRAWAPLARMSYVMYLVHIPVITYYLTLPSYTVTVNHPMVVYFFLWVLSVSALIAYICVIGFEMPLAHMEKMLFGNLPQVKRMFPKEAIHEKATEKEK